MRSPQALIFDMDGVLIDSAPLCGVEPEACVAIEDSPNGLLSAKAAVMKCIVVPEPALQADPRFAMADGQICGTGCRQGIHCASKHSH